MEVDALPLGAPYRAGPDAPRGVETFASHPPSRRRTTQRRGGLEDTQIADLVCSERGDGRSRQVISVHRDCLPHQGELFNCESIFDYRAFSQRAKLAKDGLLE